MQRGQFWGILVYFWYKSPKNGPSQLVWQVVCPVWISWFSPQNTHSPGKMLSYVVLYVISCSSLYCYDHYYHHPWTRSSISLSSKITTVNVIIITITITIAITTTTSSIIIIIIIIIISIFIVFVLAWLYIICLGIVMLFFMIGRHIYVSLLSLGFTTFIWLKSAERLDFPKHPTIIDVVTERREILILVSSKPKVMGGFRPFGGMVSRCAMVKRWPNDVQQMVYDSTW